MCHFWLSLAYCEADIFMTVKETESLWILSAYTKYSAKALRDSSSKLYLFLLTSSEGKKSKASYTK